ncbi:hypothetical protein ABT009_36760 [Streptomyces sp. NPDC002896]
MSARPDRSETADKPAVVVGDALVGLTRPRGESVARSHRVDDLDS